MTRDTNAALPDTAFWRAYGGRFSGILSWDDFDAFWQLLADNPDGWFVFDPSGDAPERVASAEDFAATLDAARICLEQVRSRSYCGAVFTDDRSAPGFVKVFDPYRMGGLCGGPAQRILPRWIFSRIAPDPLPMLAEPAARKGLLSRLIG